MLSTMWCHVCKKEIKVKTRGDKDGIWTVFCSPEEAYAWQNQRTEEEIIDETSGYKMPFDRCQWCSCTLKSGYHEEDCPVRAIQIKTASSKS